MSAPDPDWQHRILVIDDEPAVHESFRKILCAERKNASELEAAEAAIFGKTASPGKQITFEVDSAFQGEQGLAKIYHAIQEERPYAMTFLDVKMPPGWSGIEVAPKLWVADPDLQIVICTAGTDYSWEDMFAKIGTADRMFILKKPFDRMEVLQLAHNLTEEWRARQKQRKRRKQLERTLETRDLIAQRTSEKLHAEIMRLMRGKKGDG
jgi:DNA-binding NtrC family response regulator